MIMIMPLPLTPMACRLLLTLLIQVLLFDRLQCSSVLAQEGAFTHTWILQHTLVVALHCAPCLPGNSTVVCSLVYPCHADMW